MIVVETPNSVKPRRLWSSEGKARVDGTVDCGGVVSRECLGMCPSCRATRYAGAISHCLCTEGAERDVTGTGEAARPSGDEHPGQRHVSYLCRRLLSS